MKNLTDIGAAVAGRMAMAIGVARVVRRLRTDESGTTAIEFGLVAVPFIALMFAIIETALTFFAGQVLETAVNNAGRLIRTGQAQQQGYTADTFKTKICNQVGNLLDCAGLYVDVKKYTKFDEIVLTRPVDANGNLKKTDYGYDDGSGGDIVVIRAYYEWPVFVNQLGNDMGDLTNGKHLLAATAAFRNEPFPW